MSRWWWGESCVGAIRGVFYRSGSNGIRSIDLVIVSGRRRRLACDQPCARPMNMQRRACQGDHAIRRDRRSSRLGDGAVPTQARCRELVSAVVGDGPEPSECLGDEASLVREGLALIRMEWTEGKRPTLPDRGSLVADASEVFGFDIGDASHC